MIGTKFSNNLKIARVSMNISQSDLANLIGIKQSSISQFERGDRIPTKKSLEKISRVLGITVDDLTGGDEKLIGKKELMRKIKGLSADSIDHLSKVADLLRIYELEPKNDK